MSQVMNSSVPNRNYPLMTAILSWSGMAVMSSLYVSIPLMSLFSEVFSVSLTQAATTGSIFSLGFAIGCLIYGALSDKYGRKQVIVVGMIALTVISLLLGIVDSFPLVIVLRGLQGAAAATFSPVALAYTVEMYPAEKRVTTVGFISTGLMVAGIIGQVMSGYVSQQYSWNAVFYLLAIVYAITALLVWWILPKGEISQAPSSILAPIKNMGKLFTQKNLVFTYVIALVLLMSFVNMSSVLGTYLSSPTFGLSKKEILYVRSFGIIGMLISPYAGWLSKRFGARTVLRSGLILAVFSLASLGFISNLPLLVIVTILFIGGIALVVPSLVSIVGELGGKSRGIAVSVYTFILFAGTSVGPLLTIQFMKTDSFSLIFILAALVLCIGLLASFLIQSKAPMQSHS